MSGLPARWAGLRHVRHGWRARARRGPDRDVPHGQTAARSPAARGVTVTAGAQDLRALSEWDRQVTRLSDSRCAAARGPHVRTTLVTGRLHERYNQYDQGVRVYGAQLVRQVNRDRPCRCSARIIPRSALDTRATLSEDDALARAAA